MSENAYLRSKTAVFIAFFSFCFFSSIFLNIKDAPDEAMRDLLSNFIYKHGALPVGNELEIVHPIWGFSYAFYPYITSISSAFFMRLVSLFTTDPSALLAAARFTSVLLGMGTVYFIFRIGEFLFKKRESTLLFAALCAFLPQFIFLCSYQNNDCLAVFSSSLILFFWLRGLKDGWNRKNCLGLGVGCGICALSYYNAYAWILCSIPVYFSGAWKQKIRKRELLKKCIFILGIAVLIAGWFFIRNAVLHKGDFLGMDSTSSLAETYAMDEFKPSLRETPSRLGLSFGETFFSVGDGDFQNWIPKTVCSFIGAFSHLNLFMALPLYGIYLLIYLVGLLLFFIYIFKNRRKHSAENKILFFNFLLCIFLPLGMSMYNSYYSDFQPQGRYLMPSLIPVMILISSGYHFFSLSDRKILGEHSTNHKKTAGANRMSVLPTFLIVCLLLLFLVSYFIYLVPNCFHIP